MTQRDTQYERFLTIIQKNLDAALKTPKTPIFTTNATGQFDIFLATLSDAPLNNQRQIHTCRSCEAFFRRYGNLVTINQDGTLVPIMWSNPKVPKRYQEAVQLINLYVESARVTGVYYDSEAVWGTLSNQDDKGNTYTHAAAIVPVSYIWNNPIKTAHQAMAEKLEDYGTLCRALESYNTSVLEAAVLITSEDNDLDRAERVRPWAQWLFDLSKRATGKSASVYTNILWHATATAPAGWAKPRSSSIGSLLDDIAAGLPYRDIKARFEAVMAPDNYQRPQAAPAQQTIDRAIDLFAKLGLEDALLRRHAKLRELPGAAFVWMPNGRVVAKPKTPVSALSKVQARSLPPTLQGRIQTSDSMTWARFQRDLLPHARTLEVLIPQTSERFAALVTAVKADAPPILQWDSPVQRNPFSWYTATGIDTDIRKRVVAAGGKVEGVDIRGSLAWDGRTDLDLWCYGPDNHISYTRRSDYHGGNLDVDANAGGDTMAHPVENIRWPKKRAPEGVYRFFVNCYSPHGTSKDITPFRFELEVDGVTYSCQGTSNGRNPGNYIPSMVQVVEFTYRRGHPVLFGKVGLMAGVTPQRVSPPVQGWNMIPGTYAAVTAIVRSPNMWGTATAPQPQHGQHAFFLLKGCRDLQPDVGRGFFNETVRSELHEVRSVLEAYNATTRVESAITGDACGLSISNRDTGNLTVRVNGQYVYTITSWE